MVCGQCEQAFERRIDCPDCGVRLHFQAASQKKGGRDARWQNQPLGRVLIGVMLAQGLTYGLRLFVGTIFESDSSELSQTELLWSLVTVQGVQALCLLAAGVLTGAGQKQGLFLGSLVGIFSAIISFIIRQVSGEAVSEVVLYGEPIVQVVFASGGGLLGSLIWRPLPTIQLALPLGPKKKASKAPLNKTLLSGPVAWFRVCLGTVVAIAGIVGSAVVFDVLLELGRGEFKIESSIQSRIIVWEISGLAVLIGAGVAGFGAFNGFKQGFCVGMVAGVILIGKHFVFPGSTLEETLLVVFCVMALSVGGGWFSAKLFPPVVPKKRRAPAH